MVQVRQNQCFIECNEKTTTFYLKNNLYVSGPFESNCQLLINRRKKVEIKKLKIPKEFIDYLQTIDEVYENWKIIILQRK